MTHQVTVSWIASTDMPSPVPAGDGYNLYRGTTAGGENLSAPLNGTTPISGLSFVDTNVVAGTTYFYVATSVVGGVQSTDSVEISATVPFFPPTGLHAVAV